MEIKVEKKLVEICEELRKRFPKYVSKVEYIDRDKAIVYVDKYHIVDVASHIFNNMGAMYCTSAGVDQRPLDGTLAVYHIFSFDKDKLFLVLACSTTTAILKIPSITPKVPGANWAEREIRDILGIEFEGHPDPRRLILPDGWPSLYRPLRKDFPYDYRKVPRSEERYVMREPKPGEFIVPVGPYHPALHEPEYFRLYVKGDTIVDADYRGFGVHRGIEKVGEGRLTYNQIPFIAERICGICGFTHSCAYVQAVESAARIDVPERALYIRMIMLELERIHSHLLWLGVALHLLGFDVGFMHCWRIREKVMDLCEILVGNRKMYGINLVGGVRWDIKEEHKPKALKVLDFVEGELKEIVRMIQDIKEIRARTENIGLLPKDKAREICVVGPTARASGLDRDVRRDHPYAAYGEVTFKVPVYTECDVWARILVRVVEVFESISIVRQGLDKMPKGDIMFEEFKELREPRLPEFVKGIGCTEAPRGENVHFIITGRENKIYRWKVRAPTYNNLPAVPYMLKGYKLADAPIIIASIDPCFSCTDRVKIVDVKSGSVRIVPYSYLVNLSRKKSLRR